MNLDIAKIFGSLPPALRRHKLAKALLMLSPGSKIQPVVFNEGARVYADISDPFPLTYFLRQSYDGEFFRIASVFLKDGGTFFDLGANFGFCSFGLMPLFPGRITYHLFEAAPQMVACLKRSAAEQKESVLINACAVTSEAGFSRFHIKNCHLGGSHLSPNGEFTVESVTLDGYLQSKDIHTVDFMKIDIEGAEPKALLGGMKSLTKGIVKALLYEVSHENLARSGWKGEDFLNLIREMGFESFHVRERDFKRIPSGGEMVSMNGLKLARVKSCPQNFDTDLLAIHRTSGLVPGL